MGIDITHSMIKHSGNAIYYLPNMGISLIFIPFNVLGSYSIH